MDDRVMVKLTQDRYSQLLACETRLKVIIDFIRFNEYATTKELMIIAGCMKGKRKVDSKLPDLPSLEEDDVRGTLDED